MASRVEICNLAILRLGSTQFIEDLDNEKSTQAALMRQLYDRMRKATLRDFPWPFATGFAALALVEEDPIDEWAYSYRYSTGCLRLRRILSGNRNDTRSSRVSYKLTNDSAGLLVYTDQENAEIEYTTDFDDPTFFPEDFVSALAWRLSAEAAPGLTGGDPHGLGKRALQMYVGEIQLARANALNEEQTDEAPDSEFIRERN